MVTTTRGFVQSVTLKGQFYVATYEHRFCDPLATVAGLDEDKVIALLDQAIKDEEQSHRDVCENEQAHEGLAKDESCEDCEVDIVAYGPFMENTLELAADEVADILERAIILRGE